MNVMAFVGNSRVAETAGIGPTELDELERELESLTIGEKGNKKPVFPQENKLIEGYFLWFLCVRKVFVKSITYLLQIPLNRHCLLSIFFSLHRL